MVIILNSFTNNRSNNGRTIEVIIIGIMIIIIEVMIGVPKF